MFLSFRLPLDTMSLLCYDNQQISHVLMHRELKSFAGVDGAVDRESLSILQVLQILVRGSEPGHLQSVRLLNLASFIFRIFFIFWFRIELGI